MNEYDDQSILLCKIADDDWAKLRIFVFEIRKPSAWLVDGSDSDKRFFVTALLNARNQKEFQIHFPEGNRDGVRKVSFAVDADGKITSYYNTYSRVTALDLMDIDFPSLHNGVLSNFTPRNKVEKAGLPRKEEKNNAIETANREVPRFLLKIIENGIQFPSVGSILNQSRSR